MYSFVNQCGLPVYRSGTFTTIVFCHVETCKVPIGVNTKNYDVCFFASLRPYIGQYITRHFTSLESAGETANGAFRRSRTTVLSRSMVKLVNSTYCHINKTFGSSHAIFIRIRIFLSLLCRCCDRLASSKQDPVSGSEMQFAQP